MANLQSKTRKQLVLDALRAARDRGEGVLTADLENAAVGGTAGTARVRDLRREGYVIEARPHPAKDIDQYVYYLRSEPGEGAEQELIEDQAADRPLFSSHGMSEPLGKVTSMEESEEGVTMTMEPYVQWRRGKGTSSTAHYNGYDLWVSQVLGTDQWLWRAAGPRTQVDRAPSESLAKRAAIVAALT